ncbi:MAG: F0F1 ATP synthase subunit A, partial [Bacteroidetes bacterium]|nr:F0F1 ATP synthase subunit A [Fibrella sp.]
MIRLQVNRFLFVFALIISSLTTVLAQEAHEGDGKSEKLDVGGMIMHHIKDDHGWELAHGLTIPLPVILYTPEKGLTVFSSSAFEENGTHDGFINEHGKIHQLGPDGRADEEAKVYDFSITKNVASLLLSAIILISVFTSVSGGYAKNRGRAPKGLQSFMEPVIVFVRDEIARPNIGPSYAKYLPYLLTLFFFILVNNLLGLLPGAANLTGNIAVTLVLAVITFFIVNFSGNKHYWMHLVKPTGVPIPLLLIMIPVEIVGLFMKP